MKKLYEYLPEDIALIDTYYQTLNNELSEMLHSVSAHVETMNWKRDSKRPDIRFTTSYSKTLDLFGESIEFDFFIIETERNKADFFLPFTDIDSDYYLTNFNENIIVYIKKEKKKKIQFKQILTNLIDFTHKVLIGEKLNLLKGQDLKTYNLIQRLITQTFIMLPDHSRLLERNVYPSSIMKEIEELIEINPNAEGNIVEIMSMVINFRNYKAAYNMRGSFV